jgi:hypothetical protein
MNSTAGRTGGHWWFVVSDHLAICIREFRITKGTLSKATSCHHTSQSGIPASPLIVWPLFRGSFHGLRQETTLNVGGMRSNTETETENHTHTSRMGRILRCATREDLCCFAVRHEAGESRTLVCFIHLLEAPFGRSSRLRLRDREDLYRDGALTVLDDVC